MQCDSGRRVLEAHPHIVQHGGAVEGVSAGAAALLQRLWYLLHQRVHGQRRQSGRDQR